MAEVVWKFHHWCKWNQQYSSTVVATVRSRVVARSDDGLEKILKGNQFIETDSEECITDRCQYSIANVKNRQTNAVQIQIVVIRFKIKVYIIAKNQTRESQVWWERKQPGLRFISHRV